MAYLSQDSFDVPAIGDQASSMRPSYPRYGMGTGTRDQREKVFLSATLEKSKPSQISPGPIYNIKTGIGELPIPAVTKGKHQHGEQQKRLGSGLHYGFGSAPQRVYMKSKYPDSSVDLIRHHVDSQNVKYKSPGQVPFGTEPRDSIKNGVILKNHPQAFFGVTGPGPAGYLPDASSTYEKGEEWHLGMKTKVLGSTCQTPENVGPGKYKPAEAIGKQALSSRKTLSLYSFGKASRFGNSTPDLTILEPKPKLDSIGKQVKSRNASAPSFGFGTSTRDHRARTFFVQLPSDKGPAEKMSEPHMKHPSLPMEKTIVKWTPTNSSFQGLN